MPMTRQQAELAVDRDARLRGLGPNREASIQILMRFNPEEIPNKMPAGSPLARNVTRQTAISAAMGGPEEPRMVTPAKPAPVRPGIPIMAPRPEARQLMPADVRQMAAREEAGVPEPAAAEAPAPARAAVPAPAPAAPKSSYVSPARVAAEQSKRELDILNYNRAKTPEGSPLLAEIDVAIDLTERRIAQQESIANAEEAAKIDADRAAIFAQQEGQLKGQEERVGREEKGALGDALIKGGLALMNPQRGANFLAALSGGLGQGLETYDTAKAKAVEARARLATETNALALQKIDALTQARAAARQAILEGKQLDEQGLRMKNLSNDAIVKIGTRQAEIDTALANASKATTEAAFAPQVIQTNIDESKARATDLLTGSGSGGGGADGTGKPLPPGQRLETEGRLATAYAEQDEAYQNWVAAGKPILGEVKQGDRKWLAASKYEAARGKVNNLLGSLGRPKLGAAPTRRAAPRPAAAPAAGPKSTKPKGFTGTQALWDAMTPAEKKLFQ
jgi:hypothetical protein